MEYYSTIKRNKIGSFVETWVNLETVTQSELSPERKKKSYPLYMESRKMVYMTLFAKQKQRHRYREQTHGYQVGKKGWDELGDWGW